MNYDSDWGKDVRGWWWVVRVGGKRWKWGEGYKQKERCFKHEREALTLIKDLAAKGDAAAIEAERGTPMWISRGLKRLEALKRAE